MVGSGWDTFSKKTHSTIRRTETTIMSSEEIANAFIQHFYTTLDSGAPQNLHSLYQAGSTLTFEGTAVTGADAIVAKYQVCRRPLKFYIGK